MKYNLKDYDKVREFILNDTVLEVLTAQLNVKDHSTSYVQNLLRGLRQEIG